MNKKELDSAKQKGRSELERELLANRERLSKLKFDLALGKVKNIKEMRMLKRNVAQILTTLRNKES